MKGGLEGGEREETYILQGPRWHEIDIEQKKKGPCRVLSLRAISAAKEGVNITNSLSRDNQWGG